MQTNLQENLRRRLPDMLRARKMRPSQLAEAIGCSRSYLSQLMTGTRPISDITADKITKVLEATPVPSPAIYTAADLSGGRLADVEDDPATDSAMLKDLLSSMPVTLLLRTAMDYVKKAKADPYDDRSLSTVERLLAELLTRTNS